MSRRRRLAVVGGGPAAQAAVGRLLEEARDAVDVVHARPDPDPRSPSPSPAENDYSEVSALLAEAACERGGGHRSDPGTEAQPRVVEGAADEVSAAGIRVHGSWLTADAVVAAPGLAAVDTGLEHLEMLHVLSRPRDPEARQALEEMSGGLIAVVVPETPRGLPLSPYGLAMQLAAQYRRSEVRVVVTTPERQPLSTISEWLAGFVRASCAAAGVGIVSNFTPDPEASRGRSLVSRGGLAIEYDLALAAPAQVRQPALAALPGVGDRVPVATNLEAVTGLFVAGDAADSGLPRLTECAISTGIRAADSALARLGVSGTGRQTLPEPELYLAHGQGLYSRISLRYPDGMPPLGEPLTNIAGPNRALAVRAADYRLDDLPGQSPAEGSGEGVSEVSLV